MLIATKRGLTRDVEIQAIGVWDTVGKSSFQSPAKLLTFIEGALGIPTIPLLKNWAYQISFMNTRQVTHSPNRARLIFEVP